jgi:hypothetical protein
LCLFVAVDLPQRADVQIIKTVVCEIHVLMR